VPKRRRRLGGIGQGAFEAFGDGAREVLDGAGMGDDDRLEQGYRNEEDLGRDLGHEVGQDLVAGHEGHLAECPARFEFSEFLADAGFGRERGGDPAGQDDAEMAGVVALVGDRFAGLVRANRGAGRETGQFVVGEVGEEGDSGGEETGELGGGIHGEGQSKIE
jgi:hypothetical protein